MVGDTVVVEGCITCPFYNGSEDVGPHCELDRQAWVTYPGHPSNCPLVKNPCLVILKETL